ncbi:MAG: hypothetical protein M1840_006850 [Geoglossum simile]|nr:MAG: hypothetical protein M1840_006850 [Geoglossum simile]
MLLLPRLIILLNAIVIPAVVADVRFTTPSPGASVTGGTTLVVEWEDSGVAPELADLATFQLFLCAGSNDNPIQLASLSQGSFAGGSTASGTLFSFLKMISVASAGGTVINYSSRFSLTGMTGTFPQDVIKGLASVSGTDGPPTVNGVAGSAPGDGPFAVPYTMQTGPTRYAPMQPQPGSTITAKKATPLWPSSSVTIATAFLPRPTVQTTITQSPNYSATSVENDASAAPMPMDDMQKFLNRWKD